MSGTCGQLPLPLTTPAANPIEPTDGPAAVAAGAGGTAAR